MSRFCAFVERHEAARFALSVAPLLAVLLVALIAGCSLRGRNLPTRTAVSVAPDPALEAQCARMNRHAMGFTAAGVGFSAAGAATGLSAMFTDSTPRWATGATSAVTTIGAAVFTTLSNLESAAYTKQCTAGVTGAP